MTLIESINLGLKEMTTAQLVEVARLVHELVPEVAKRQRVALAELHGCMDDEEGAAFEAAVLGTGNQ